MYLGYITLTIAWLLLQCILELLPEKYPKMQYNFYRYSKPWKRKKKYPGPLNLLNFYVHIVVEVWITHTQKRDHEFIHLWLPFSKNTKKQGRYYSTLFVHFKGILFKFAIWKNFKTKVTFEALIGFKTMYHKVANSAHLV